MSEELGTVVTRTHEQSFRWNISGIPIHPIKSGIPDIYLQDRRNSGLNHVIKKRPLGLTFSGRLGPFPMHGTHPLSSINFYNHISETLNVGEGGGFQYLLVKDRVIKVNNGFFNEHIGKRQWPLCFTPNKERFISSQDNSWLASVSNNCVSSWIGEGGISATSRSWMPGWMAVNWIVLSTSGEWGMALSPAANWWNNLPLTAASLLYHNTCWYLLQLHC